MEDRQDGFRNMLRKLKIRFGSQSAEAGTNQQHNSAHTKINSPNEPSPQTSAQHWAQRRLTPEVIRYLKDPLRRRRRRPLSRRLIEYLNRPRAAQSTASAAPSQEKQKRERSGREDDVASKKIKTEMEEKQKQERSDREDDVASKKIKTELEGKQKRERSDREDDVASKKIKTEMEPKVAVDRHQDELRKTDTSNTMAEDVATELTGLDSSTIEMYTHALESGSETSSCTRVSIIGPPHVGKTSLVRNLQEQSLEGLHSTDGINVCKVAFSEDLNITENPVGAREGAERIYNAQSRENAGESEDENLDEQTSPVDILSTRTESSKLMPSDLQEETYRKIKTCSDSAMNDMVTFQDVMRSSKHPCKINTVNIWDYGGQCEYYSIHQLFHSERAVYIFVFDISTEPSDVIQDQNCTKQKTLCDPVDALSYCKCWIHSIHTAVGCKKGYPKVILVGTHKDKLTGREEDKQKIIEERFEQMRQLFDGTETQCNIDSEDFVIDNHNPTRGDIQKLKQRIQYLEKGYNVLKMPVKWIPLEIALRTSPQKCITLNKILDIDKESTVPINNMEEIRAFLKIHHMLGNLVYFDDGEISDFVILDPQWIIDAFIRLVTAERRCRKIAELRPALKSLREEAVLQDNLIQIVWNDTDDGFLEYKKMLLKVLINFHIIIKPFPVADESCKVKAGYFIVPSLLQRFGQTKTTANLMLRSELQTIPLAYTLNNSYIAQTIFHRILAALISEIPIFHYQGKRMMNADIAMFKLENDHVGIVEYVDTNIEIRVVKMSDNFNAQYAINFRKQVEKVIDHCMQQINIRQNGTSISSRDITAMKCLKGSHCIHLHDLAEQGKQRCFNSKEMHFHDMDIVNKQWIQPVPDTVTDRDIQRLAGMIGGEWESVAFGLDIQEEHVSKIKNESNKAKVRNYLILKHWLTREGEKATWAVLFQILPGCEVDMVLVNQVHSGISC